LKAWDVIASPIASHGSFQAGVFPLFVNAGAQNKKPLEIQRLFINETFAGLFKLGAQEGTRTPTKLLAST
jgi:hypothetical protein